MDLFALILCVLIPFIIVMLFAILGLRSRMKFVRQIQQAQAEGRYDNWNIGLQASNIRIAAIIVIISLLALIAFIVLMLTCPSILRSWLILIPFIALILIGLTASTFIYLKVIRG